jgi:hypothetical protein
MLPELPADQALERTTALMIEGTTLMPARVEAMTKGDWAAVPVSRRRSLSLEGTMRPTMKMERTASKVSF